MNSVATKEAIGDQLVSRTYPRTTPRPDIWHRVALLVILDVTVLMLATWASEVVVQGEASSGPYRWILLGTSLLALNIFGLYRTKVVYPLYRRIYELTKVSAFSLLFVAGILYLWPAASASRSLVGIAAVLSFGGLVVGRTIYHRLFPLQQGCRRLLIVGTGFACQRALAELRRNPTSGFEVVGLVEESSGSSDIKELGLPVLGAAPELISLLSSFRVDTIILAVEGRPTEKTIQALGDCVEQGCDVFDIAGLAECVNRRIPVRSIDGSWFIRELSIESRQSYQLAKRLVDVFLSLAGLLVTALIFPMIAFAIRLDSSGPIIYSQIRVGRLGKPFRIYKFRSMRQDAESKGAVWASAGDARVTPVGRFMRQTRLDELPQLFNVLVGEMSLVGPRPERPEFVSMLGQQIPHYTRRHMVLPGLTGWAQVRYSYGASVDDALEKLQYDLYYIKNRCFFLDLEILLRTVSTVINKIGAR